MPRRPPGSARATASAPAADAPPAAPRARRARRQSSPPDYVQPLGTNASIVPVELGEIDLEDKTYQFRVNLRVGDLVESIKQNGQQIPVLLRRVQEREKYQIISGFRRIQAIGKIGWVSVNALVLDDLSDEAAWRVSVVENEARKTYSDLDRAYAILAYRKMGHTVEDIATQVFQLSRKQVTRLKSLTDLPPEVQQAIADERISTTQALVLKQLQDQLGKLDYAAWIHRAEKDGLSVGGLRAAILASQKRDHHVPTLYARVKDRSTGRDVLRLRPAKIDPESLNSSERKALAKQLEEIIRTLKSVDS